MTSEGTATAIKTVEEVGAALQDARGPNKEIAAPRNVVTFRGLVAPDEHRDVRQGEHPYR